MLYLKEIAILKLKSVYIWKPNENLNIKFKKLAIAIKASSANQKESQEMLKKEANEFERYQDKP